MEFQELLIKRFGKRVEHVTLQTANGLVFQPEQIFLAQEPNKDKCSACPAHVYRQDLPFWLGSHRNKKLMVIAQDAGKGEEDYGFNTVFSIHAAHLNKEEYFKASSKHHLYYAFFQEIIGSSDFLQHIYFTDIVKCAYSTGPMGSFELASCKQDIEVELKEVNPTALLLMGKPAQHAFTALFMNQGNKYHEVKTLSCQINKRGSIAFTHLKLNDKDVFLAPHLIGNLHIGMDFKTEFLAFKQEVIAYMHACIN